MTKFSELKSIVHNAADSLGSGIGLLVGEYCIDIYGEVSQQPKGYIQVNFLTGEAEEARISENLSKSILLYKEGFSQLCRKHGIEVSIYDEASATYYIGPSGPRFTITVRDQDGRSSKDDYIGVPGKKKRYIDQEGRVRS